MKSSTIIKIIAAIAGIVVIFILYIIIQLNANQNDQGILVDNEKTGSDNKSELENFSFSMPELIYGSDMKFISIGQKNYYESKAYGSFGSSSGRERISANILFFNYERNYYKLLLNEKASINRMDYPSYEAETLQKNIFYDISLKDTDGNGLINSNDNSEYFISDLDGSNFKKLKLDGYKVNQHEFADMYQSIYLLCSVIPKDKTIDEEYWERTLLEYDIKKGELIKHDNLNMLLSKAKEIMVK